MLILLMIHELVPAATARASPSEIAKRGGNTDGERPANVPSEIDV